MSDDEPVDILPALREECNSQCTGPFKAYTACSERIEAKGAGECEQWYFDFLKCVDKCAAPKIFSRLK